MCIFTLLCVLSNMQSKGQNSQDNLHIWLWFVRVIEKKILNSWYNKLTSDIWQYCNLSKRSGPHLSFYHVDKIKLDRLFFIWIWNTNIDLINTSNCVMTLLKVSLSLNKILINFTIIFSQILKYLIQTK